MKKTIMILAAIVMTLTACADNTQVLSFEQLPNSAQSFIEQHFSVNNIAIILCEKEGLHMEYEIRLNDGTQIEFNHDGQLEKIDCLQKAVPQAIIPHSITTYVDTHHKGAFVVEYSIDRREQSIELNNQIEIEFDRQGNFLRYDM